MMESLVNDRVRPISERNCAMSLNAPLFYLIPEDTARVARAAFPKGTLIMDIRDTLGPIYLNPDFAHLFAHRGRPAEDPAQLALILVLQTIENLSDAQAADAVRGRVDWKYALALDLDDPGFEASILSDFRTRLLTGAASALLLDQMLERLQEAGLLKGSGRQRTDSTHVQAAIRTMTRLTMLAETMRHALNDLATIAPDWLRGQIQPDWADRYAVRIEDYRLPKKETERQILVATIGADGFALLQALATTNPPADLIARPAIQTVRQMWIQQYYGSHDIRWRSADDLPPHTQLLTSPYDGEARFATKRDMAWTGYKVHLTETCDATGPHVITHVATTLAPIHDVQMLPTIHAQLSARQLLPHEHLVDAGYVAADMLVASQQDHHIDLIGPPLPDSTWQARTPDGLDRSCFAIDWDAQQVTCPAGKRSVRWTPGHDRQGDGQTIIAVQFDPNDCTKCPLRSRCTQAKTGPRTMKLRPREQHEALLIARRRQQTDAFKHLYAQRSGIEGTLSQGVRAFGLRYANYIGLAKTHLQHLLIAVAINIVRVVAWIRKVPQATTRTSPFAKLVASMT
jgi:transposase